MDFFLDTRKIGEEERKKNIPVLYDYDFLEKIIDEVNLKVVNERETIRAIFVCSCGRLVANNQVASYNLMVNDESGAGKDFVTGATLQIWNEAVYIKRTRISPTVFTYWHIQTKKEKEMDLPEWTWDGKVLYLEDVNQNVLNSDVFKVMCSSGSFATIVKDQRAVDLKINGKPVIIITSAAAVPSLENIRRFSIVNLDTTPEQTREIMRRHGRMAAQGRIERQDNDIKAALTYLNRYPVKVPYAEALAVRLTDNIWLRTVFNRFVDIIRAVCALYQYQREIDSDGYLIANEQDYEIAKAVILKMTSNARMISLTKNQQKILALFTQVPGIQYSVSDLEPKVTFISDRWLRVELEKLSYLGFLKKEKEDRFESKKPVMVYSLIEGGLTAFPSFQELLSNELKQAIVLKLSGTGDFYCKSTSGATHQAINTFNTFNSIDNIQKEEPLPISGTDAEIVEDIQRELLELDQKVVKLPFDPKRTYLVPCSIESCKKMPCCLDSHGVAYCLNHYDNCGI